MMTAAKTVAVSFRVSAQFKALLKAAAERERRSQANLLEVLLLDHCGKHGITVSGGLSSGGRSKRSGQ